MAACSRCGSPTPPDSSSCPACGPAPHSESPEPAVLDPTERHIEAESDDRPAWLIGLGLAIVLGLVGFFAVLSGESDDAAEDSPAPTPAPDAVVDGDEPDTELDPPTTTRPPTITGSVVGSLVIEPSTTVDGYPIGLVEQDGATLAFVAANGPDIDGATPSDVSLWELGPAGAWVDRGVVIAGAAVAEVVAEPDGLVAVGVGADGRPTAWRSDDGLHWWDVRLHEGTDRDIPFRVVAVDGLTVAIARPVPAWAEMERRASEAFGPVTEFGGIEWDREDVLLRGPLGLILAETDLQALGFELEELLADDPAPAAVWDDRGTGWRLERFEQPVVDLYPGPPGEVLASVGVDILRFDGITWIETPVRNTWDITRWDHGFVGRAGSALHVLTAELEPRSELVVPGPGERLIVDLATNADGLAVAVLDPLEPPTAVEPASLERDGLTISVDLDGPLEITDDVGIVLRVPRSPRADLHRDYVVDIETATVTFLDPDTGDRLMTLTLDELRDLETSARREARPRVPVTLAHTTDGENWHTAPFPTDSKESIPERMAIVGERIVVAAVAWGTGRDDATRTVLTTARIPSDD